MVNAIHKEALELAAAQCIGRYGIEHIRALRELAEIGLVKRVTAGPDGSGYAGGSWYEITDAGRSALESMIDGQ